MKKYAIMRAHDDSAKHDLSMPTMRRRVGQTDGRKAEALRQVQNAVLGYGSWSAPDGQAEEGGKSEGEEVTSILWITTRRELCR